MEVLIGGLGRLLGIVGLVGQTPMVGRTGVGMEVAMEMRAVVVGRLGLWGWLESLMRRLNWESGFFCMNGCAAVDWV
jgi:hypothetical protein